MNELVKFLYLFAGFSLNETYDAAKTLYHKHLEYLEKRRDSIQEYRPNPAMEEGSLEANEAIARHQHRGSVAQEVAEISKKIRIWRFGRVVCWGVITVFLVGTITFLETRQPKV